MKKYDKTNLIKQIMKNTCQSYLDGKCICYIRPGRQCDFGCSYYNDIDKIITEITKTHNITVRQ